MDSIHFYSRSVKEFQQILKDRGVIFSDQKKVDLHELCETYVKLNIEVDPVGLLEDRDDVWHIFHCMSEFFQLPPLTAAKIIFLFSFTSLSRLFQLM